MKIFLLEERDAYEESTKWGMFHSRDVALKAKDILVRNYREELEAENERNFTWTYKRTPIKKIDAKVRAYEKTLYIEESILYWHLEPWASAIRAEYGVNSQTTNEAELGA